LKPLRYKRAMGVDTKKTQAAPDTFSVSSLSRSRIHKKERPTMDINDLFGLNHQEYQPV